MSTVSHVAWVRVSPAPGRNEAVASLNLIADLGIEGDRHAKPGKRNQVLLMDCETLDALELHAGHLRENIATRGVDLILLQEGDRLRIGTQVELLISHPCAPCHKMDAIRDGLQQELEGRRGMLAVVVSGGAIAPGDEIEVQPAAR